ncbi:TIGR04141 family sporadically distributed protein [Parvibaculaceae bacterium PLY_AMNH_Bact1]|nr:TIGR04141 family sporadically distributed protein [Parvibaculaceae bacterium PLY_AMNH_Bact1]
MSKSKTYSLYLVKLGTTKFKDVFTETSRARIESGEVTVIQSKRLGDRATAYIFENTPRPAPWLKELHAAFQNVPNINNRSSSSVVVFKQAGRLFATSFAHGWQYIDDTKIESDFGLRVTINSINDSNVKRVDSNHLGEAMKGVSQSAFQRDLQSFGIDEALELVRKISGRTDNDAFASSLAGATALKITKEMELTDLADIANEALQRFVSNDYAKTGFAIIDKVRPTLDRLMIAALDAQAVEAIKTGKDDFELSMPGWSEDDVVYFGFKGPRLAGRFPDLLMSNYRDALGDKIEELDVDVIASKHGVIAEFNNDAAVKKIWSIKKALIGSVFYKGGLYAISEGDWFRLDTNFKADVDSSFKDLIRDWKQKPLKIIEKAKPGGKGKSKKMSGFESELSYNQRCAAEYGQICLDQQILMVPSVPYGKFEACDLLDIDNKKLIHVKKSSRQSSVLSHFFKQGANSAKLLKLYPEAAMGLVKLVGKRGGGSAAKKLKAALGPNLSGWTVEYHIVDAPRNDGSFNIPFFSRITLRDEARALKGMEFNVCVKFIAT